MNTLLQCKTTILSLLIADVLACFALLPRAEGVVPAPDGGYPGGNTAEGQNALFSLTTGTFNTGVGFLTLRSVTDGQFNTAVGAGALLANTAGQNTATGAGALLSNSTGFGNTADGAFALFSNSIGQANTANGVQALFNNIDGFNNTAIGFKALFSNINQDGNTAIGSGALAGSNAGQNTAIGVTALQNNISGTNNTALGRLAGNSVTTASNVICIGANVAGEDVSNTCYIGNIFGVTSTGGVGVFVNPDGKLGTNTSSRRFKEAIQPMETASQMLFSLKPVSFRYRKEIDPTGTSQLGLVAEDVERVSPDLVVRDKEGQPYSVRYDQVNAMLLNEFLKEHRMVQTQSHRICELEATITELKSALVQQQEQLKAFASGLEKVSAQLQLSKPASQTVAENP